MESTNERRLDLKTLLTTTSVRYSNKTNRTGCETTLNSVLRDVLKVKPDEDDLVWMLVDGKVMVAKKRRK